MIVVYLSQINIFFFFFFFFFKYNPNHEVNYARKNYYVVKLSVIVTHTKFCRIICNTTFYNDVLKYDCY